MSSLQASGVHFACRYLSYDKTGKNLSLNEANLLKAAGIAPVSNWEWTKYGALGGFSVGAQHAHDANFQHFACGGPDGRPIYFSVDFDAQSGDVHAIAGYFDGIASVIPTNRIGVYGGYYICASLWSTGRAKWIWQTSAWSGSNRHPQTSIYQHQYGVVIGGVPCDIDESYGTDYGQWGASTPVGGEAPVNTGSTDLGGPLNQLATWSAQGSAGIDGAITRIRQLIT